MGALTSCSFTQKTSLAVDTHDGLLFPVACRCWSYNHVERWLQARGDPGSLFLFRMVDWCDDIVFLREAEYNKRMNTDRGIPRGFAALHTPAGYARRWV